MEEEEEGEGGAERLAFSNNTATVCHTGQPKMAWLSSWAASLALNFFLLTSIGPFLPPTHRRQHQSTMYRKVFFMTIVALVALTASAKQGDGVDLDPEEKVVSVVWWWFC